MYGDWFEQEGLMIAVPKDVDKEQFKKKLEGELEAASKIKDKEVRDKVSKLIKRAIEVFPSYPNRLLRFYIHENAGCPNDVDMDWKNTEKNIEKSVYWYNAKKIGGEVKISELKQRWNIE